MRVGIVCPYSYAVPGGVQNHVADLAKALLARGHEVSVLAPAAADSELPHFVQQSGRAVGVPFNGSVARLQFGPVSAPRVRRWLRDKVAVATQAVADAFAEDIALRPHDWHMLQRLWVDDLPSGGG